jgi:hypothetical protein
MLYMAGLVTLALSAATPISIDRWRRARKRSGL